MDENNSIVVNISRTIILKTSLNNSCNFAVVCYIVVQKGFSGTKSFFKVTKLGVGMEMDQTLDKDNTSVMFSNTSYKFNLVDLLALCDQTSPNLTLVIQGYPSLM